MTMTLVIGSDDSVLEGIAQALGAAGHRTHVVRSLTEASAALAETRPVVAVIERAFASDPEFAHLRLPPGSAVVLYRDDAQETPGLPAQVQRLVLADLVLPLERQRLVTMVQRLTERAVASGRARQGTPPEDRAV